MTRTSTIDREESTANRWSDISDEQLMVRYQTEHDRQAFTELVQRYERELYNYLRRYLGDATMAEDAFQTTFMQVHLKCDQYDDSRKFRPWLYTIATNQAIDAQRRAKRHRSVSLDYRGRDGEGEEIGSLVDFLVSKEQLPHVQLDLAQQRDWLKGALEQLPEPLRAVVHLVYYQGLKYREAAEALRIPVGTIKSRMHGAILKLNEAWQEHLRTSQA